MLLRAIPTILLYTLFSAAGAVAAELDDFPAALDGHTRHVIQLPRVTDQSRYRVELVPGRAQLADCRLLSYRAGLARRKLDGGARYYVLGDLQPVQAAGACADTSRKRRFVRVRGDGLLVPYDSRQPLVVYLPPDVQLKYRIWRADKSLRDADQ
ncbi:ecotin family protein [Microbulbifer sp. SAOS-129_SWC]|uniref:ecotin family protein n=1 Tax=Microbulbifer sp. SAOS-129_SWC TaxID=3145235 RepID=UPI003217786D